MKKKILIFIFTIMLTIAGLVNVNAYDKYDGDYTIEYLLRNYNVVTLGTKPRYDYSVMNNGEHEPGSVTNVFDIGGPVLIRGNYTGNSSYDNEFAQKTNCIPSYIKGRMGPNINPGSIESAELSNIYVGSYNALKQEDGTYKLKGSSNEFNYPIIKSDDYLDFDKLYAAIVNEQKNIDRGKDIIIDDTYMAGFDTGRIISNIITINEPGYYTIDDISGVHSINIPYYNPSKLYVITVNSEKIQNFPMVKITTYPTIDWRTPLLTTPNSEVFEGRTVNDAFDGNIVWNLPNARYIHTGYTTMGHIIAPKADIELIESHYPGAIVANSITSGSSNHTAIQFYPYKLNEQFSSKLVKTEITEDVELTNDLYEGNYSIDELLKNYSVIALGQKDYEDDSKLANLTDAKGTVNVFHIAGQFLINGNLGVDSVVYTKQKSGDFNGVRLDFRKTDKNKDSYIKGNLNTNAYDIDYTNFQYLNDAIQYAHRNRTKGIKAPYLYVGSSNEITYWKSESSYINGVLTWTYSTAEYLYRYIDVDIEGPEVKYENYTLDTVRTPVKSDNYIKFNVLYDAIVEQQSKIDSGTTLSKDSENKVIVPGNGNYTINNVSDVDTISFIDYETNKKGLTIVTINDSGTIEFPKISTDGVPFTNDYYGGDTILGNSTKQYYEKYIGNIVWNIPNATRIVLPSGSPFVGHVIAPNADLETPETQLAGAMIVNSLYAEGHSELHFYPLNAGSVGKGIELETKTIGEDEPDKITISGTKTWDDKDNQDGVRPDSVTINLLANGEKVDSVEVSEDTDWKYEFNVDRVDSKGVKIVYTITENSIDNYATEIETITDNTCPEGCIGTIVGYNITNSYTPKKTSLTINKVWNDDNNREGKRPEKVEIQLYADGEKLGAPVEVNEDNNWTYIFNDLDMRSKGKDIKYTVEAMSKLHTYKVEITGNQEEGYTITNTYIKEIKENPTTGDNISKFTIISIISSIILVLGIIVFTKFRRREV